MHRYLYNLSLDAVPEVTLNVAVNIWTITGKTSNASLIVPTGFLTSAGCRENILIRFVKLKRMREGRKELSWVNKEVWTKWSDGRFNKWKFRMQGNVKKPLNQYVGESQRVSWNIMWNGKRRNLWRQWWNAINWNERYFISDCQYVYVWTCSRCIMMYMYII